MKVNVLCFGPVRDCIKADTLIVDVAGPVTAARLLDAVAIRVPALAASGALRVAINRKFATGDQLLRDGDEVALIAPVSGG